MTNILFTVQKTFLIATVVIVNQMSKNGENNIEAGGQMIYEIILAAVLGLLCGGIGGYYLGRYQDGLIDKIRTLEGQSREEPKPEPAKPVVTGGAYQPPHEFSTSDSKQKAGIVETKTPELLSWENDNELAKLEHGG
jgi:hypothetical protein